jgi:multicomponent Na+:H+ antiporter subunit F
VRTVTSICLVILVVSSTLCLARALRPGSSLADRIVALDSMLVVLVAGIAVLTVRIGSGEYVDVLVIAALLGFLATTTVARYIERRGA